MTRNIRWKHWPKLKQRSGSIRRCQFWGFASYKAALMNINNSYQNNFISEIKYDQTL